MNIKERLDELAAERILILDGAMGSLIQERRLTETDFRGERFKNHDKDLAGCSDILCLTKPEVIASIHEAYLSVGADIIETCSFGNATSLTLEEYNLSDLAYEISYTAAKIARKAADSFSTHDKPRFVAGSIGPLTKSSSISPDIEDPGKRGIYWDEMVAAYYDNARGLLDGGADLLMVETVFDTLNAKAALFAISALEEERNIQVPVMISATISDASGRLLSGQTIPAFCTSVLPAKPWSLGLNCSLGADKLKPYLKSLADFVPCFTSVHPNAGMPNEEGAYDDSPSTMADCLEIYMKEGLLNIVGGCCGSTPAHISAIASKAEKYKPRVLPVLKRKTYYSGFEVLEAGSEFIKIGERANVAGSRKFLGFIQKGEYHSALGMVREMIEQGSQIVNVCMDDAMLDAEKEMTRFLSLALSDPDIAKAPIMLDSSRWDVILAGLKLIQGKSIVNSISLKDGEKEFLRKARIARRYGAAVVVMLFDEEGQASSYEKKIAIAERTYRLLTDDGFPPEDIIFDAVVLTIATGIKEHDSYALNFIKACEWITKNCPHAKISGGIGNLSFAFQGNNSLRSIIHCVFLKHAVDAGLSMAIVNTGATLLYQEIDPVLREAVENLILCKKENAAEELLKIALEQKEKSDTNKASKSLSDTWRSYDAEKRIIHAVVKGIDDYIADDVLEVRPKYARSLEVIEGPLMKGMQEVGELFGEGKMFLPQVIRSARVMQKAVAALKPFMEKEKSDSKSAGKILLATVKGDVHDIGKNFVGVVLGCNGYEVLDLGVMIPGEKIVETAIKEQVSIIGLSGLITPSLDEMIHTAELMEKEKLSVPLLIGGAAASLAHTALRIAPKYSGPIVYVKDASRSAEVVRALLSQEDNPRFLKELAGTYREAVERHTRLHDKKDILSFEEARKNKPKIDWSQKSENPQTNSLGIMEFHAITANGVLHYINWDAFMHAWALTKSEVSEKEKLRKDAVAMLDKICKENLIILRGVFGLFPALSDKEDVIVYDIHEENEIARFSFLRNQERNSENLCLADFILPKDLRKSDSDTGYIGLFAIGAGFDLKISETAKDDYESLLISTLSNTLVEAFAEEIHYRVRHGFWGYAEGEKLSLEETLNGKYKGLRPAIGYPVCPDHEDKRIIFKVLSAERRCGFELTETAMIIPASSVCGFYFASPSARYFSVGFVGEDQLRDWSKRKGISEEEGKRRLGKT